MEIYTTRETRNLLKVSESTIKRLLKRGIIRANKVGGHYRILGKELIRILSPQAESKARAFYSKIKKKTKEKIKTW